jgi:HEAT repeat protein
LIKEPGILLIQALKSEDLNIREGAAVALKEIKSEKAVTPLIQVLMSKDMGVSRAAALALGEMKSEKAVEPLINAYKNKKDENSRLRVEAIEALGKIYSKVK